MELLAKMKKSNQLKGYADLAHDVIKYATTKNDVFETIMSNGTKIRRINVKETNKLREIHRTFAKNSPLINHFCDLFEYDEVRIRKTILTNNKQI